MLLNFLRWLRANADLDFSVVLIRGGELVEDFTSVAPVTLVREPARGGAPARALRRFGWTDPAGDPRIARAGAFERGIRLAARGAMRSWLRRELSRPRPPDLVYLNTVASGSALSVVSKGTPVLTHVHELGAELRGFRTSEPDGVAQIVARTRRYIAVSRASAKDLTNVYGIDAKRIDVCYGFTPIPDHPVESGRVAAARAELRIEPDTLVVGSVGTVEWRKGPDLFIQVARRVLETRSNRNIAFLWVGQPLDPDWERAMHHDIASLGLADRIQFVGGVVDARPFIEAMDIFLLTSRSDAFPLTCLEAAAQSKPIVSFNAGGITEFLNIDRRLVVPYLDVPAMADRVVELLDSPLERYRIGKVLATRVRAQHRLETSAPILRGHIERMLEK